MQELINTWVEEHQQQQENPIKKKGKDGSKSRKKNKKVKEEVEKPQHIDSFYGICCDGCDDEDVEVCARTRMHTRTHIALAQADSLYALPVLLVLRQLRLGD